MSKRYSSLVKTLAIGAVIGTIANTITNAGGYFGSKVIKKVSHVIATEEIDDGKGHKITYSDYPTASSLLKRIFEGDFITEKINRTLENVFSFAQEEKIPCNCVPLLSLLALQSLNITIIVDDSTSMGWGEGSRWNECKKFVSMIFKYAKTSEDSLVGLKFLNQETTIKLTDFNEIEALFARNPFGGTPLIKTLESAITDIKNQEGDRRHLVYVFTDGVPNDGACYQPMLTWVRDSFAPDREVSDKVAINFIVAEANPSIGKEYKKVDSFIPSDGRELHIDTNLSYKLEQARCSHVRLTEGLYKVKLLIGAANEDFNSLDKQKESLEDTNFLFLKRAIDSLKDLNAEILLEQKKSVPQAVL